jgi:nucleoid-associated protein YgaU
VSDLKAVLIPASNEIMNRSLRIGLLPAALALAVSLRADDQAAPAQKPDDVASLRADNKQLSDELAAAWKEADRLKADLAAAQAASAKGADETADLRKQLDAAKAQAAAPAPAPAPEPDTAKLADLQEKLDMSLRSFSVVQDENNQAKASLDKANSDNASLTAQLESARASTASLQAQLAASAQVAAQVDPLRSELRHSQDEAGRLAGENTQLRTRVALQSPSPGSSRPAPMRPGQAPAVAAAAEVAPAPPAPAPAPRTHVVAEGDTLTKISRKYYGSSGRWEDILNANRDVVKDEKSLVVGSTLKIP